MIDTPFETFLANVAHEWQKTGKAPPRGEDENAVDYMLRVSRADLLRAFWEVVVRDYHK